MVQPVAPIPPALRAEPASAPTTGRRGAARLRLAIPVRLLATHLTTSAVLLDLSRTGARVGMAEPFAPATLLYLKVEQLEIFSEVVRRHCGEGGGVNGLVFDEPLCEADVLAVRRHAETYAERERAVMRDQVRRWVSGEAPI
ncbi:MAG: hypothetical protein GC147_11635 [Porphyrobacter sp.]|nr:hypothetical protein [Porphyrobacter sp.]